jgi:hypothetical protein
MTAVASVQIVHNAAWDTASPRMSVLTPFFRYDPCGLLTFLDREASGLAGAVDIVSLDDGSGDEALASRVAGVIKAMRTPAEFVQLGSNEGRSRCRNRLAARARGRHFLFLDADMVPDSSSFLASYVRLIDAADPPVVVGGMSVQQAPLGRRYALHRRLTLRLNCLPAAARRAAPEKYVFTGNLLMRRDVFLAERFDATFSGWGWEDVELGIRISRRWPILHIDNTATHLGLETSRVLIAKYRESVGNFGRFAAAHPDVVAGYPSYRAARLLRRAPLRVLWRPLLAALVLMPFVPVTARSLALRLYRASLYADVI